MCEKSGRRGLREGFFAITDSHEKKSRKFPEIRSARPAATGDEGGVAGDNRPSG